VWCLRSYKDEDTHYGRLADDGVVAALHGLRFTPMRRLFEEGPAVVHPSVEPLQACPACRDALHPGSDGAPMRPLSAAWSKH
jgi:hypothetical protein